MKKALILHGGCGVIDLKIPEQKSRHEKQKDELNRIVRYGWDLLSSGESSLDAVEKVMNELELSGLFNAGTGSVLGDNRQIEMEASIMNGKDLSCGSISGLTMTPLAISVARRVMEKTRHVFIAGPEADEFAKRENFK